MTLSVAQQEAYARAKTSVLNVYAIELRHPTFVEPLRVVSLKEDLTVTLESNAPVDASAEVVFSALAMRLREPDINSEADTTFNVQIDGVPGAVQPYLAAANKTIYPIEATTRIYLYDLATASTIGGAAVVMHLQVRSVQVSKTSVSLTMGFTNPANRSFPSQLYTPETNPGLV
jgi:hypothetical protein